MLVADAAVAAIAAVAAAALQGLAPAAAMSPWWQLPLFVTVVWTSCAALGLYSAVIRYITSQALFRLAGAAGGAVVILLSLRAAVTAPLLEPLLLINFGILLMLALGSARIAARHFLGRVSDNDAERLLIYGAGEAGVQVASSLESDPRRRVVGFVDARPDLTGSEMAGLTVYPPSRLAELVESKKVTSVLLALPSISRRRRQEIVDSLEPLPVTVKTVPALQEILSGQAQVSEIRDIDIVDLLGRDPVPPDDSLLAKSIVGRTVMVTGAGGSIGSELCRQIVQLEPAHLVLFETNEYSLYYIEREVREAAERLGGVHITAVLGNVLDRDLVTTCIRRFRVQTLYHAAAYKHVPLVEQNIRAGLRNNIFGTWNVAEAALVNGVERFILISTDKAVRPTNVMGATKRVAELVVQAMAQRAAQRANGGGYCRFSMVRFGNVLGSSGSVVPHFREQIRAGGPVTVTHPEITRYFMTIPEASQLVIQAGAMSRGGEVFVLDMGRPVRILDLAKRMIRLAGYSLRDRDHPDGDIEIVFTNLRPGEKLYEELLIEDATIATSHPKIGCAEESFLPWPELEPLLQSMYKAIKNNDGAWVKRLLQQAVSEYIAAEQEYDTVSLPWQPSSPEGAAVVATTDS